MIWQRKYLPWIGLIKSLPAVSYCFTATLFAAWLSAAEPAGWPADKSALSAYGFLAMAVISPGMFIYCFVHPIRSAGKKYEENQSAT